LNTQDTIPYIIYYKDRYTNRVQQRQINLKLCSGRSCLPPTILHVHSLHTMQAVQVQKYSQ